MIVSHGVKKGKEINYPTLNIYENIEVDSGVYACKVLLKDKVEKGILTHLKGKSRIEIHLLNFSEDVYGESVEILDLKKIRDFKTYKTLNQKIENIEKDIDIANEIF